VVKYIFAAHGDIGNVSKNASMMHIAEPVSPMTLEPLNSRRLKKPAKASDIRLEAEDRKAARRLVCLGPAFYL
jgi:hypothetical protein